MRRRTTARSVRRRRNKMSNGVERGGGMYPLSPIATIPVFTRFSWPRRFPWRAQRWLLREVERVLGELEAFDLEHDAIGAVRKISRELEAVEGIAVACRHPVRKACDLKPLWRNQQSLQQQVRMLR